jgi:hypothetical protein
MGHPDVSVVALDEANNRILVGVEHPDNAEKVRSALHAAGIPTEPLYVTRLPRPVPMQGTLQDEVRPTAGGVEVGPYTGGAQIQCSMAFNAVRNGESVFVTASHCSVFGGVVDTFSYWQPNNQNSLAPIGREVADPPPFTSETNPACPVGRYCRYSDAIAVGYFDPSTSALGRVENTFYNDVSLADPQWQVMSSHTATQADTNQAVFKVGRTTGTTVGVLFTCTAAIPGNFPWTFLDQCGAYVYYAPNGAVHQGDSGGTAFWRVDTVNGIALLGVVMAGFDGFPDCGCVGGFYFSQMSAIFSELGNMTVVYF